MEVGEVGHTSVTMANKPVEKATRKTNTTLKLRTPEQVAESTRRYNRYTIILKGRRTANVQPGV